MIRTKKKKPRHWVVSFLIGTVVALGVVLIIVLALIAPRAEQLTVAPERPVPVRVIEIRPRPMPEILIFPGCVEPKQQAQVAAEFAGRVIERLADKGQTVTAGQVLLRIDNRLPDAAYRRAALEARDTARDLARWQALEQAGAVAVSDYEDVLRRQQAASIILEETKIFLEQCEIRAPFPGVIVERFVEHGEYVNEGQVVFALMQIDPLTVVFDVPERHVHTVVPGQLIDFHLSALSEREFSGVVTFVASQATRASNTFTVELTADNPDGVMKAGMIARVSLMRRIQDDAIVLPLATIVPLRGEYFVYVVHNDRAVRRRVVFDSLAGQQAVIASGLRAGELIVAEGQRGLRDGMAVSPEIVVTAGGDAQATDETVAR